MAVVLLRLRGSLDFARDDDTGVGDGVRGGDCCVVLLLRLRGSLDYARDDDTGVGDSVRGGRLSPCLW